MIDAGKKIYKKGTDSLLRFDVFVEIKSHILCVQLAPIVHKDSIEVVYRLFLKIYSLKKKKKITESMHLVQRLFVHRY